MALASSIVGAATEPLVQEIDARWTMAYAAGLADTLACYFDTRRAGGVVAHPLFPVCFEWASLLKMREMLSTASLTSQETLRAVHATHDTVLLRQVRAGDRLSTRASVVAVEQRKPGAYMTARLDTIDASGARVCTTWCGSIYRGVEVIGANRRTPEDAHALPAPAQIGERPRAEIRVPISPVAAHVYSECARIWNPIHTDAAVAQAAGLPAIILHGTATLALAVSRIVEAEAGGDPGRVMRIAGRFGAMVLMPSEMVVRILARESAGGADRVYFEALNAEGNRAIRNGLVELRA